MENYTMDLIKKEMLLELSTQNHENSLTLYLPSHRTGSEMQQDPIRLKNLVSKASEALAEKGMDQREIKKTLRPVNDLLEDSNIWQHMSDGLAIFINETNSHIFRVPITFEEQYFVGAGFYLKPLMPLISGNGEFFILALSQKETRLMRATRETVEDIVLEDIPEGVEDLLAIEEHHDGQQFHSGTPSGASGRAAIFHGHGDQEDGKDLILRYFQQIDKTVCKVLQTDTAPLILAGVDYLHSIYKSANNYGNLYTEGVEGNLDHLSADQLHEKAWEIVQPHFMKAQHTASDKFQKLNGTGKASDKIKDIWEASQHQKIETLFLNMDEHDWGTVNGMNFELHSKRQDNSIEILDYIATQTLQNGGEVFAVSSDSMPADNKLAAVFRY